MCAYAQGAWSGLCTWVPSKGSKCGASYWQCWKIFISPLHHQPHFTHMHTHTTHTHTFTLKHTNSPEYPLLFTSSSKQKQEYRCTEGPVDRNQIWHDRRRFVLANYICHWQRSLLTKTSNNLPFSPIKWNCQAWFT